MCNISMPTSKLQAHHIRPKSLYPEKAYLLDNGICLCILCHMHLVHGGNSFIDVVTVHQWRFFVPSFDRYVELSKNRRYNEKWQVRLTA
jgi:hypothetical protein